MENKCLTASFIKSTELNQNHIRARLQPGELLLHSLHDDPDRILSKSLHLGERSLVFSTKALPPDI